MLGLFRLLLITTIVWVVYRVVRRILTAQANAHYGRRSGYDRSKEVRNAGFSEDDVQDARYRDIK